MLRAVAKWYISRSIDCDRPLPKWVAERVERDPNLKRFYQHSLALTTRLQSADLSTQLLSPQLLSSQLDERSLEPHPSVALSNFRGRFAAAVVALAAGVLLMLAPWFKDLPQTELVEKPEQASASGPVNTADLQKLQDLQELKALVKASREMLQSVNLRASQMVEPIAYPMLEAQQMAELLELDVDQVAEQVVEPAGQVGTSYGQLLTGVDKQLAEDNRRMIASGVEAWKYFTHKVPQQAASLAGWSPQQ